MLCLQAQSKEQATRVLGLQATCRNDLCPDGCQVKEAMYPKSNEYDLSTLKQVG